LFASVFLVAAPAAAGEPSPTPHPTGHHVAHRSPRPTPVAPAGSDASPGPIRSGGRFASGLPGIDGRVVALGSVLGLGALIAALGMRRD
jgi:hypothetical protein